MVASRAPCQSCSLPFYIEQNDQCPYCGQSVSAASGGSEDTRAETVTVAGTTTTAASRPRVTCDTCGLPYYDDHDDCPYCAAADHAAGGHEGPIGDVEPVEGTAVEGTGGPAEAESADSSGDTEKTDDGTGRESSLLGTLLRPLRNLFGG